MKKFDVVVIGAGPGGYVSAIRLAQLGKKVAIIEANHLGGICLNWGCIPTKSLLRSSEILHFMKNAKDFGLSCENIKANLKDIVERSRKVAGQLSKGVETLLKKNKVEVIKGFASFTSPKKIKIDGEVNSEIIEADNFVIATGARARILKDFEPNGQNILTYKEAMIQEKLPKSLVVVGSGAIGIEFASFYSNLGVEVTILEAQDRILPQEDKEIADFARKSFSKQNMNIHNSVKLKEISDKKSHVLVKFSENGKEHEIKPEKVIMAVGVVPNTENLGLEKAGVKLDDRGLISTNGYMQTSSANIYAIGDVTYGPWLAHKASHEGVLAAEHICGKKVKIIEKNKIPGCTYSMPQIASIGITEEKAKSEGLKVKIGRFPFIGNGKAIALGEPEGLVKIIFEEKTGELLGCHMIGAEVTELIHSVAVAMSLEATEEDIFHIIFPHPTLSEMLHESALAAYGRAIHI